MSAQTGALRRARGDKESLSANRPRRRRAKPPHEPAELIAAVARMLNAIGNKIEGGDPHELSLLVGLRDQVDAKLARAIAGQRAAGYSDREIGEHLGGVTKQAVQQRWPR